MEKISQITQIKGWNLRVKFSCRKSSIFISYEEEHITCGVKWVCVLGGTGDRVIESRATVYRVVLQSGEFFTQTSLPSSQHTLHQQREGEQWRHVWSQVTNLWSFCWAHGVQRQLFGRGGQTISSPWFWVPLPTVKSTRKRSQRSVPLLFSLFRTLTYIPHSSHSKIETSQLSH